MFRLPKIIVSKVTFAFTTNTTLNDLSSLRQVLLKVIGHILNHTTIVWRIRYILTSMKEASHICSFIFHKNVLRRLVTIANLFKSIHTVCIQFEVHSIAIFLPQKVIGLLSLETGEVLLDAIKFVVEYILLTRKVTSYVISAFILNFLSFALTLHKLALLATRITFDYSHHSQLTA